MANDLQFSGVVKRFGGFTAVRNLNLTIKQGEFFSFLGPSGCGKTTILRMISGFIEPSEGDIRLGARSLRGIGPNKRPTALIFQNLALFPLMTVEENIGFGLEVRGVPAAERRRRVDADARADRAARLCQPAHRRAVRRPEAAGGDRPRAGRRAQGAAARRAAVGARPQAAAAHAGRAARRSSSAPASPSSTSPTTRARRWPCPTASR